MKHDRLDPLRHVLARVLGLVVQSPPAKVWEWAETHRRMGKDVTAKPGRYRVATAPYQREPQEAFFDPEVQTTVLYFSKRMGKTEVILNLHGYVMDRDPKNILHVLPTLDSARKFSKQFLAPLIRSTKSLAGRVKKARGRDSGNTILSKEFPGGTHAMIGSNSPSAFRQVRAPMVTCDEIDAMEDGPEGDPVDLAFGRAENYPDTVQVVASTATKLSFRPATEEGERMSSGSRIHDWWLKSDQRKWHVLCPACKKRHVMDWKNMAWPGKDKTGEEQRPEEAEYVCPLCKAHWNDAMRMAAVMAGVWLATAKFTGVRGYWLNGLNTTFAPKKGYKSKLHQMAGEYLDALKSDAKFTAWKNTFLCEPIEEQAERIEPQPLMDRREDYTPDRLPLGVALLAASVDVQGDRVELEVVGMGEAEETWGVEHRKIIGNIEHKEVWDDLTAAILREYRRSDGVVLKVVCTAIDLRHRPQLVRRWIKTCGLPRVYGVYGTGSGKQVNLVVAKHSKFYGMFSYSVNTDLAKDTIFARLKLKEMGPRYMHFAGEKDGYDQSYFDQLTAEEKRVKYVNGFPHYFYHKPDNARNEALDQRVYFLAAMDILRPNPKAIEANRQKPEPAKKEYVLKPHGSAPATPPAPAAPEKRPPAVPTQRKSRVIGGVGRRGPGAASLPGGGFGNLGAGSYKI